MKLPLSYQQLASLIFITPVCLLLYAYYLQFFDGQEPCPLCMTQRICFYLVAIFALCSLLTARSSLWRKVSNTLIALSALLGLGVAIRQLWLQSLPADQVPACGPSFEFIVQTFPLSEAIAIMFRGTGDCAEVAWSFLGLSIAGWSAVCFAGLAALAITQLLRKQTA